MNPQSIAAGLPTNKIYVANGVKSVTVIDGNDDRIIKNYPVGPTPFAITADPLMNKIYVTTGINSVTVINDTTDNKIKDIPVGAHPVAIAADPSMNKIYVTTGTNSVTVIDGYSDNKIKDIPVGKDPSDIVVGHGKIYVANAGSNTVSVINAFTDTKERDISVGLNPVRIAYDDATNIIYVANQATYAVNTPGSVSVIDGSSDKVAAGVIFNVNPGNSGKIKCNNVDAPTNIYLYVDTATNCIAQPNKDFEFNSWTESPLTSRNSSIPLDSSGNITVNRFGMFTVNFKQPQPLSTQQLFTYLTGALGTAVAINGAILTVPGWRRARKQSKTLSRYLYKIDAKDIEFSKRSKTVSFYKLEYLTFLNDLRKEIISLVQKRAINESQYQILDDKITEYANRINDKKGLGYHAEFS